MLGRKLEVVGFDNKLSPTETLIQLKNVTGQGFQFLMQGVASSIANPLIEAVNKYDERNPKSRLLYLNFASYDPSLTNEKCNYWFFHFDSDADMKMKALTTALAKDPNLKRVYIIGQDYSFGKVFAAAAVKYLKEKRPDIQIVGNELHPLGSVKDFSPYIFKIKASGAQAIITGNYGADMLGLAKAAEDASLNLPIYTYSGATTGITKAIGAGGVGRVFVVHESVKNPSLTAKWEDYLTRFKKANPDYDVAVPGVTTAIGMLAKAIDKAQSTEPIKVAAALEGMEYETPWG